MVGDYISRDTADAAIKAAADHRKAIGVPGEQAGFLQAHDIVRNLPDADVVEVVRCRDCVYWEPASPTRTSGNCNRSFDIPAWATDFCSYGKRKDGGQDDV